MHARFHVEQHIYRHTRVFRTTPNAQVSLQTSAHLLQLSSPHITIVQSPLETSIMNVDISGHSKHSQATVYIFTDDVVIYAETEYTLLEQLAYLMHFILNLLI